MRWWLSATAACFPAPLKPGIAGLMLPSGHFLAARQHANEPLAMRANGTPQRHPSCGHFLPHTVGALNRNRQIQPQEGRTGQQRQLRHAPAARHLSAELRMTEGAQNWPFLIWMTLPVLAAATSRSVWRHRKAGIWMMSATCVEREAIAAIWAAGKHNLERGGSRTRQVVGHCAVTVLSLSSPRGCKQVSAQFAESCTYISRTRLLDAPAWPAGSLPASPCNAQCYHSKEPN